MTYSKQMIALFSSALRQRVTELAPRSVLCAVVMLAGLFTASPQACAANKNPNTDWFKDCRWGIFVHYLWDVQNAKNPEMDFPNRMGKTTDWDTCVKEFDTEKFAQQIKEIGAPYVFFTMMQRTRYLIAPNATYDKLTGYKPGEACATRDLVEDLYTSLNKRGIKLMLYWTGDGPRQDEQAAKALGWERFNPSVEFVEKWAAVATEYGERYKDKVPGWWVDGCYGNDYDERKRQILARGLRAGNPKRILAFNAGCGIYSVSEEDDFTPGEMADFLELPVMRWRDGKQFHVLSFLGPWWGKPGVRGDWAGYGQRYDANYMADYVGAVNDAGGVVSIDVALFRDGSIDPTHLATVKAMNAKLEERAEKVEQRKQEAVPPGNLAFGKPARLLNLDGLRLLPPNGGGGESHGAECGVDGDRATTARASGNWAWTYQVDLGAVEKVSRIVATFGKDYPTHFEVQIGFFKQGFIASDDMTWHTVAVVADHDGSRKEVKLGSPRGEGAGAGARYVRIRGLKPDGPNQTGGQMSVAELEVYGVSQDKK